jgi:hypothetical protein
MDSNEQGSIPKIEHLINFSDHYATHPNEKISIIKKDD